MSTVYLIHFDQPVKHAQHYLGYTRDLEARIALHQSGFGARLLAVVQEQGIGWSVVRTWVGGRTLERKLKNQKNGKKLCPVCKKKEGA